MRISSNVLSKNHKNKREILYQRNGRILVNNKYLLTHMVEQSKLVSNHLFGLVLKESAHSIPESRYFNSGQMKALPAYAPSTCSHTQGNFLQTWPISGKLSNEQHDVVPKVVETKNGISPIVSSSSIA